MALMTQFPHAPARGPGAGDADDATITTTHTQQRRDPASFVAFQAKMTERAAHTNPVTVTIPALPRRLGVIGQNVLVLSYNPAIQA